MSRRRAAGRPPTAGEDDTEPARHRLSRALRARFLPERRHRGRFPFDTIRAVADLVLRGAIARRPRIRMVVSHGGGALPALADRVDGFARLFAGGGGADAAVAAVAAAVKATPLLSQELVTAMMTTNALPLLGRFGA